MDTILLIDALRHDYIDEEMPFLAELKRRGSSATIVETMAFQTRPAYLAGLEPVESDICSLYRFDPLNSPWKWLSAWWPATQALEKAGGGRLIRSVVRRIAKRIARSRGENAAADVISTSAVPFRLLPFFTFAERSYTDAEGAFGTHPTVFDLCRRAGRSYRWIGYPRHNGSSRTILAEMQALPTADVQYVHLSELDWIGHAHGTRGPEMRRARREMDGVVQSFLEPLLNTGGSAVVFGDHGMVDVCFSVDIEARLRTLPLTAGVDYVYFLDSTQARFWFLRESARPLIESALHRIPEGHVATRAELASLGINFHHNGYGELIFLLDGPGIIHPSFFARGQAPRGMHGYLPSVRDNLTQALAVGHRITPGSRGTLPMTAIFALICETLGLSEISGALCQSR